MMCTRVCAILHSRAPSGSRGCQGEDKRSVVRWYSKIFCSLRVPQALWHLARGCHCTAFGQTVHPAGVARTTAQEAKTRDWCYFSTPISSKRKAETVFSGCC